MLKFTLYTVYLTNEVTFVLLVFFHILFLKNNNFIFRSQIIKIIIVFTILVLNKNKNNHLVN